jgi:hypothetical protein
MILRCIIIIIIITATYKKYLYESTSIVIVIIRLKINICRFWWPCGLRHKSVITELLGSGVRILLKAWKLVFCVLLLLQGDDHYFRSVLPDVCVCV